jgi:hypothetical protein
MMMSLRHGAVGGRSNNGQAANVLLESGADAQRIVARFEKHPLNTPGKQIN